MNIARLFQTDASYTSLFQRLLLGAVILPHGAQKLFGWFGGWGWDGTLAWFDTALHVPAPLAALVILSDFFGSLLLIAGAFTRVAAFGASATMLGAILMVHAPNGFFMNWSGAQAGEGFEFHLLALATSLPLIWRGAGAWSLDRAFAVRFPRLVRRHERWSPA
jgi:putative oxidoreductase